MSTVPNTGSYASRRVYDYTVVEWTNERCSIEFYRYGERQAIDGFRRAGEAATNRAVACRYGCPYGVSTS